MEVIRCCICSKIIKSIESNNPWPVREYSYIGEKENRCCHECNNGIVLPIRLGLISVTTEEVEELHKKFKKMDYYELANLVSETGLPSLE